MREGSAGIVGYTTDTRCDRRRVRPLRRPVRRRPRRAGAAVRGLDVPGPVDRPAARRPTARTSPTSRAARCASCGADGSGDRAARRAGARRSRPAGSSTSSPPRSSTAARGFWWSPDSDAAARRARRRDARAGVVDRRPGAPRSRRRGRTATPPPARANADVSLELVRLDGTPVDGRVGPRRATPTSSTSRGSARHDPLLVVMTRDQRDHARAAVDPATGRHDRRGRDPRRRLGRRRPRRHPLVARRPPAHAARRPRHRHLPAAPRRRLAHPGRPAGARRASTSTTTGVLVATAPDPLASALAHVGWDGTVDAGGARRTAGPSGAAPAAPTVLVSRTLESLDVAHRGRHRGRVARRGDVHAERPAVTPRRHRARGRRAARSAHGGAVPDATTCPGSRRLPVLLSPYGGPHHQEVVASGRAFGEDQWLADQGFCVVVADGRGHAGPRAGLGARGAPRPRHARARRPGGRARRGAEALARRRRHRRASASAAGRSAATSPRSRCCAAPTSSTPRSPAPR